MTVKTKTLPFGWALLEALPTAILYKESVNAEVLANKAALTLLQLDKNNAVLSPQQLQQIMLSHPGQTQPFQLHQNPLLIALSGSVLQQDISLADGTVLLLQSVNVTLPDTLQQGLLISLQQYLPLSCQTAPSTKLGDEILAESEIAEAIAFDKLMSLISTQLINVQDNKLDHHIESALAAVGEFCHSDRSYVFQFNESLNEMSNTHEWVRPGVKAHKEQLQQIPEAALPYFFQQLKRERLFVVNAVSVLPASAQAEKKEFAAEDIQSVMCCAMIAEDKLLGFVGCDMVSRQRDWTKNDLRRLKLIGEILANTLQNVYYRRSLQQMQQQLLQVNQELEKQASQDGLTGIANRRHFDHCLQAELQRCSRNGLPLGLILLDIDRFKLYNDHYGHQAGDDVLKQVASVLSNQARREGELSARYGGEEFALILPASDLTACITQVRNIQRSLVQLAISHAKSDIATHITASLGLVCVIPNKQSKIGDFIQAADRALYQAKAQGRNQFISCQSLDYEEA